MQVSIVGAGGDMGRQIAATLLVADVLGRGDRLQLVPRRGGPSEPLAHGMLVDLLDADAEDAPVIEVVTDPDDVGGDIVVVAAGATVSTDPAAAAPRDALAATNLPVFREVADVLDANLLGHEFVLVVSNPVELAVQVLARRLGPDRVLGMGAHLDSLRFRREVAADLGLRRQQVQALVLGEHGAHQVPCWSTLDTWGDHDGDEPALALRRAGGPSIPDALGALRSRLVAGDVAGALDDLAALPPDLRAATKPFLAQLTGAKTAVGVARAVTDLIDTLARGRQVLTAAQVDVQGRFHGVEGVTGVPVRLATSGVVVEELDLWSDELDAVAEAARVAEERARALGLA